jgi:glycosyltransferase involved in cell wall biosynthesis
MDLISVVIPTYNRFTYVQNTIKSIQNQTYKNIEIIVVNDASTQQEYYTHNWQGVTMIHLPVNSKKLLGYPSGGFCRGIGILRSTGKYVAFCDDDDVWLPHKLEKQLAAMNKYNCKFSSTDGYIGRGVYDENRKYPIHIAEYYYEGLNMAFLAHGSHGIKNGVPPVIDFGLLQIRNLCITSSVIMERGLLDDIGGMYAYPNGKEDYECWLRALMRTNCAYVSEPCIYYDLGHGDGQNYQAPK